MAGRTTWVLADNADRLVEVRMYMEIIEIEKPHLKRA